MYRFSRRFKACMYKKRDIFLTVFLLLLLPVLLVGVSVVRDYSGRALIVIPANIVIQADEVTGPLPHTWRTLAQGGEEKGVRMLEPVVDEVSLLEPRYIRIDHIYDFYDVVSRDARGSLTFSWSGLDQMVCDILQSGAKPFFSLGYMPETMSNDGTLTGIPRDWNEWELLVQATIERYSGINTVLCGNAYNQNLDDVYYEVWNEPDLETFGKWSIHSGKDYKLLYYYSAKGAEKAVNTRQFFLGGPATTADYQNWIQLLIKYADAYDLKLDFLSWHHYGTDVDSFANDMHQVNTWLSGPEYAAYRSLPRIISEWGFDSNPNPISETNIAAAHTVSAIRYLVEEDLEMAFAFEIRDGINPSWGILSYTGDPKPRYYGLRLLNVLGRTRVKLEGEGTYVKALASRIQKGVSAVVVNYDIENAHTEVVPFTINGLQPGLYSLNREWLNGEKGTVNVRIDESGQYSELLYMEPNSVVAIELRQI
ncbi:hypothetical protein A3A55_01600 [Candidatus Roizmanbacteria bacterium RIFCSPLOWO2_01_FULL_40_14]|nr:MAG: hypothetical protein A3A55_01600 [Candidatus Roizmanbacteria bacterium RIFCSPLOWO2_01_FULL_40_14]